MDQYNYDTVSPSVTSMYQSTPYVYKTEPVYSPSSSYNYSQLATQTGYNPYMTQFYPWTSADYTQDQNSSATNESAYLYASPKSYSQNKSSPAYSSNSSDTSPASNCFQTHDYIKMASNLQFQLFNANSSPINYHVANQNNYSSYLHDNSAYSQSSVSIDYSGSSMITPNQSGINERNANGNQALGNNQCDENTNASTTTTSTKKLINSVITPEMMSIEGKLFYENIFICLVAIIK